VNYLTWFYYKSRIIINLNTAWLQRQRWLKRKAPLELHPKKRTEYRAFALLVDKWAQLVEAFLPFVRRGSKQVPVVASSGKDLPGLEAFVERVDLLLPLSARFRLSADLQETTIVC